MTRMNTILGTLGGAVAAARGAVDDAIAALARGLGTA